MNIYLRFVLCAVVLSMPCPRVSAASIAFSATLLGANESPPVATPGTGNALVIYDDLTHKLNVQITFADLTGITTVAHIHAPTAVAGMGTVGVATFPGTFPGFPVGVNSGNYDNTWDLANSSSYTAGFLTAHGGTAAGAEAGLMAALIEGKAYVNIHSTYAPGGEIRGFLARVPDSGSTGLLLALTMLGLLAGAKSKDPLNL